MKTITNISRLAVPALFVLLAQPGFAQQSTDRQEQQSYQIKIVKDENGNQEVIDKTFNSRDEMEAYVKENKIDVPETKEPPSPPAIKPADDKTKRIVISEIEQNGKTSLEFTYENFSSDERARLIQDILNDKWHDVKIEIAKQHQNTEGHNAPPSSVNEPTEAAINLTDVKVFPNPATGQFHVAFSVTKPTNLQVTVDDLNGKEVYAEAVTNYAGKFEKEIDGASMVPGTYIVNIQAGTEKRTTRVVMQ